MRKSKIKASTGDIRGKESPPKAMPAKKLRTARERTYQSDRDALEEPAFSFTVQGVPVTLMKRKDQALSTFTYSGGPEEISVSQFMAAYGSEDPDFVFGLIGQLANVGPQSKSPDVNGFKFALAAVRGMAPRDPFEAMICAQMAVVHATSMMFAERLANAMPYTLDIARQEQVLNRFVRTHSALRTALERHRNARDRNIARQHLIANGAHANESVLPKLENQIYLRDERNGEDAKRSKAPTAGQGSQDPDFASGLFGPLVNIGITRGGFAVDEGLKFVRAAVKGMAPQDPLDEQICAQAAVVHSVAMIFANRLSHAEDSVELQCAEQSLNRLSRSFCTLMEAIDRHREGSDRKIARQQVSNAGSNELGVNGKPMPPKGH